MGKLGGGGHLRLRKCYAFLAVQWGRLCGHPLLARPFYLLPPCGDERGFFFSFLVFSSFFFFLPFYINQKFTPAWVLRGRLTSPCSAQTRCACELTGAPSLSKTRSLRLDTRQLLCALASHRVLQGGTKRPRQGAKTIVVESGFPSVGLNCSLLMDLPHPLIYVDDVLHRECCIILTFFFALKRITVQFQSPFVLFHLFILVVAQHFLEGSISVKIK